MYNTGRSRLTALSRRSFLDMGFLLGKCGTIYVDAIGHFNTGSNFIQYTNIYIELEACMYGHFSPITDSHLQRSIRTLLHDVTWHPFGIIYSDGADAAIQERIQDEFERRLDRRVLQNPERDGDGTGR